MNIDPEPLLRLLLAALLALPIGLEREIRGKPAGVRTHLLLAVATAGLGWLSIDVAEGRDGTDAARIASYTVAGIGFLGAGLIVGVRGQVHGLTTAVAAFMVMTIGLAAGMGYGMVAATMTALSLITLGPIEWVKPRTYGRMVRSVSTLHIVVGDASHIITLQQALGDAQADLQSLEYTALSQGHTAVQVTVRGRPDELETMKRALEELPVVGQVTEIAHHEQGED